VRLGHRALFEALLTQVAGAGRAPRAAAAALLRAAGAASPLHPSARLQRWPAARAGLEAQGLPPDAVGRAKQLLLQAAGEAQAALVRLAAAPPPGPAAAAAVEELRALLPLLGAWGVPAGRTALDPLLPPHADYFSGAVWEVHLVLDPGSGSGGTTLVAAGGRYDALLRACWARQSAAAGPGGAAPAPAAAPLGGVGVTLSVERLAQAVAAGARPAAAPAAGLRRLSASDVLVCSRGAGGKAAPPRGRLTERTSGRLMERVRLLRLLWDAGVAAETLPSAAPSLTDSFAHANAVGIPWLVIIADEMACECACASGGAAAAARAA
jgi:translation initiation factor 2-alpha kinase 4